MVLEKNAANELGVLVPDLAPGSYRVKRGTATFYDKSSSEKLDKDDAVEQFGMLAAKMRQKWNTGEHTEKAKLRAAAASSATGGSAAVAVSSTGDVSDDDNTVAYRRFEDDNTVPCALASESTKSTARSVCSLQETETPPAAAIAAVEGPSCQQRSIFGSKGFPAGVQGGGRRRDTEKEASHAGGS